MLDTDDVYIVRIQHSQAPKGIAKGKAWFLFALFCFLLQEQKEGPRGEPYRLCTLQNLRDAFRRPPILP